MIEILEPTKKELKVLANFKECSWINIENPTEKEIKSISNLLKVKSEDYSDFREDVLSLEDMEEIPMIDKLDDITFIITRTPQKRKSNNIKYYTVPLGILITKKYIITISFVRNQIVEELKTKCTFNFKIILLTLKLMLISSRVYLRYLKEIDKKINSIETKLEKAQKNKEIMQLLDLKKSLVYFNTSLKNDEILIERMSKTKLFTATEDYKDLIEDVIDENKQAIEMTSIYSNIIKDTLDVFSSIISNNLNAVMKFLTSVTIIIALPTLIASIYGMNVTLPFQNHIFAFSIVILISVTFSLIGVLILKKWKLF
jgi:magnesium transporter